MSKEFDFDTVSSSKQASSGKSYIEDNGFFDWRNYDWGDD
jgi:hypothetical protein